MRMRMHILGQLDLAPEVCPQEATSPVGADVDFRLHLSIALDSELVAGVQVFDLVCPFTDLGQLLMVALNLLHLHKQDLGISAAGCSTFSYSVGR